MLNTFNRSLMSPTLQHDCDTGTAAAISLGSTEPLTFLFSICVTMSKLRARWLPALYPHWQ